MNYLPMRRSKEVLTMTGLVLILLTAAITTEACWASSVDRSDVTDSQTCNGRAPSAMREAFGDLWQAPKERIWNNVVAPIPASPLVEDLSILNSENLPQNTDYTPEVGNGNIATVVGSDAIFMNGLYNGANGSSHRARIPSPAAYSFDEDSLHRSGLERSYSLDLGRGIFTEVYQGGGVSLTLRTYAHCSLSSLIVSELILTRDDPSTEVNVRVNLTPGSASEDLDFVKSDLGAFRGLTREPEYPEVANQTEMFMLAAGSLEGAFNMTAGSRGETYLALTAISHSRDIVLAEYTMGLQTWESSGLLKLHTQCWANYWNTGRIDIQGNATMSRLTYASLYYIMSSLPLSNDTGAWPYFGISPGGLAHGAAGKDYLGHVFWDQDVWIYPTIAMLHPHLGRRMVQSRTRILGPARTIAKQTGYQGARFPWEAAFTGFETCPSSQYGELEIHVTADVILMLRQYWWLTNDTELMFNSSGAELAWDVAEFWASRVTPSQGGKNYSIIDVMPPDEWHAHVNDSAYTNNIAAICLDFANYLKKEAGQPMNPIWADIAEKLIRPYDATLDYHPEYDGFKPNMRVKQADVVLLGYPLQIDMSPSTLENDLTIYDKSIPLGPAPAMTWSMFLVNWLALKRTDEATKMLPRAIKNAQEPFLVWSEDADGDGAVNFLTGMGGYLQSLTFGYAGCRVTEGLLTFDPVLMPYTTGMHFIDLNYQGCSFDLEFDDKVVMVTLNSIANGRHALMFKFSKESLWEELQIGKSLGGNIQAFDLQAIDLPP